MTGPLFFSAETNNITLSSGCPAQISNLNSTDETTSRVPSLKMPRVYKGARPRGQNGNPS